MLLLFGSNFIAYSHQTYDKMENNLFGPEDESKDLIVLWTSGDKEVALNMVFMYTYNAKKNGWWENITLIVWGPSAKLSAEDKEIADNLKGMMDIGIIVEACKGCSDRYGVSSDLEELGIDVRYIGVDFTNYIKKNNKILTF